MSSRAELGWVRAAGDARQIGLALGRAGRAAVHRDLLPSAIWSVVTDPRHAPAVARLSEITRVRFPAIWAELEGLAEGLGLPLLQVMAWNCRGDLLASSPDGCTTVQLPGRPATVAHNEDGLPFFRGSCFVAEVAPEGAPGFHAFCYPGSIAGHTFAVTGAGLAQTVNNMRLLGVQAEIPRMVLARAVLGAETLDAALEILRRDPRSGGFHMTLAKAGDPRLLGVEYGDGRISVREIAAPSIHANHALHLPLGPSGQIVTASSRDRQARGEALLHGGLRDPLAILRDTGGGGLPICRIEADDPDEENTLATLVVRVGCRELEWSIRDSSGDALYRSDRAAA